MSKHCPQDGGFIGDAGCTHPNHEHSALVKRIVAATKPKLIPAHDATAALNEGFYVKNADGVRVGFGKRLLEHLDRDHAPKDADGRKQHLMFAVDTVRSPDKTEKNHRGYPDRTFYTKDLGDFNMVVISAKGEPAIEYAFTVIPKRKGRKS